MPAPSVLHELLDRVWDLQRGVGTGIKIRSVAQTSRRPFAAEFGKRRIVTPPPRGRHWVYERREFAPWQEYSEEDLVEAWHQGAGGGTSLAQFMSMDEDEYAIWVARQG